MDISELVPRLDKVIARIDIPVVFQRWTVSARGSMNAQKMTAKIGLEGYVEKLDEHFPHIMTYPLFEDIDQKASILLTADGTLRYQVAGLGVEQPLATGLLTPALVRNVNCFGGGALDHRDELQPLCCHLLAEETINRAAIFLVRSVHRAQNVEVDAVFSEVSPALHDTVKRPALAAIKAVLVVQLARSIDTQPDQEIILFEELAPLVIEKDAICLKGVLHGLVWPSILLHELNGLAKELDFHQGRLATLPGHGDVGRAMRLQELPNISFKCRFRHPILFVRIESF